jgi:hypothetical protein
MSGLLRYFCLSEDANMNNVAEAGEQDELNAREGRSPAYPAITLKQALMRAASLRKAVTKNEARIATAGNVWGLGVKSSGLRGTIAALKQFGLIEYIGSGTERKIKLSDAANRIVLDQRPESPEREALIQKAALAPKAHAQLWEKWGADLPPDVEILAELMLERGFSNPGAAELISEYKATLAFAKLIAPDKMPDEESDILETSQSQTPLDRSRVTPIQGQRQTAINERIVYKPGQDISVGFSTEPDIEMYEFLRDYLDFRIQRMKKQAKPE